jgi:hypothetical protein
MWCDVLHHKFLWCDTLHPQNFGACDTRTRDEVLIPQEKIVWRVINLSRGDKFGIMTYHILKMFRCDTSHCLKFE